MKKILDKRVGEDGYTEFASSIRLNEGRAVRFVFSNRAAYDVPAVVLRTWRGTERRVGLPRRVPLVRGSRRVARGQVVRIYWGDGVVQDVPWDSVLMGCEPRYEHFGGLTRETREISKLAFDRFGPFAVE